MGFISHSDTNKIDVQVRARQTGVHHRKRKLSCGDGHVTCKYLRNRYMAHVILCFYMKSWLLFSTLHHRSCCHTLVRHFHTWVLLKVKHKTNLKIVTWKENLILADMLTGSPWPSLDSLCIRAEATRPVHVNTLSKRVCVIKDVSGSTTGCCTVQCAQGKEEQILSLAELDRKTQFWSQCTSSEWLH